MEHTMPPYASAALHTPEPTSQITRKPTTPREDPEDVSGACAIALDLLSRLETAVRRIPSDSPRATIKHRLGEFSNDPSTFVLGPADDDWEEVLNPMMKRAFGWGDDATRAAAKEMLQRGQYGLDGFLAFIRYFVKWRGLKGGMFESKVMMILEELEASCVRPRFPNNLVNLQDAADTRARAQAT
jgi:hypothetical protein